MADDYKPSFKLGNRKGISEGLPYKHGEYSESRRGWVACDGLKSVLMIVDESSRKNTREVGNDVVLIFEKPRNSPLNINLSILTEQELVETKKLIDKAFEEALPVVKQRDKDAENARQKGDDSFIRQYRALPTVVYREGPKPKRSESLLLGPDGVPQSEQDGSDTPS